MVEQSIVSRLGFRPRDLTRALGVSSGHASDLKKGRRKLTVEQAAKLEAATGVPGIVSAVVEERTGGA